MSKSKNAAKIIPKTYRKHEIIEPARYNPDAKKNKNPAEKKKTAKAIKKKVKKITLKKAKKTKPAEKKIKKIKKPEKKRIIKPAAEEPPLEKEEPVAEEPKAEPEKNEEPAEEEIPVKKIPSSAEKEEIKRIMHEAIKKEGRKEKFGNVTTGLKQLDKILDGGLQVPSVTLLEGPPGSGKTAFSISFISNSLSAGKKGIYICTNNFPNEIRQIAESMGYDLKNVIFVDSYSWLIGKKSEEINASSLNLSKILESLENILNEEDVECIVLDSLSSLLLYHEDRSVERFVQSLAALTKDQTAVSIIIVEKGTCNSELSTMLEYLVDGIMVLEEGKLTIKKTQSVTSRIKELRFEVTKKGVEISGG